MNKRVILIGAYLTAMTFLGFCSTAEVLGATGNPTLITQIRVASSSEVCCNASLPVAVSFCMGYDFLGFPELPEVSLGCEMSYGLGVSGYVDFDASTAGFSEFVNRLTDGLYDTLEICEIFLDANANVILPGGCAGGSEGPTFGHKRHIDLAGFRIDFIRLVINKVRVDQVDVGFGNTSLQGEWDYIWQLWRGVPLFAGSNQTPDVNAFLRYKNPLQRRTIVPAGIHNFYLTVIYGTTTNASTFHATLNGRVLTGLNPVPGETETLSVPLSRGHNELVLKIDGTKSNGRIATDTDRLIFIVEE